MNDKVLGGWHSKIVTPSPLRFRVQTGLWTWIVTLNNLLPEFGAVETRSIIRYVFIPPEIITLSDGVVVSMHPREVVHLLRQVTKECIKSS